jgi:cytochrome c-type biogenesis protein CcmH/NrfG
MASELEQCYRLLEVEPDASADDIRGAYLVLVNVWHPDRFQHDPSLQARASEKLRAFNRAFQLIKEAPLLRRGSVAAAPPGPVPEAAPETDETPPEGAMVTARTASEWFQLGRRLTSATMQMSAGDSIGWSQSANLTRHVNGIRAYREALRANPELAEAWVGLGLAHAQIHEYEQAVAAFREAVRLRPEKSFAWIHLGTSLAQLSRYTEVVHAFRMAVRLSPQDASAWYTLGVACSHSQVMQLAAARDAYREAVRLRPELAEAWFALGTVCLKLREEGQSDPDEVVEALREAVRMKPDLVEAWVSLGATLCEAERYDEAEDVLRQAVRLKPDSAEAWYHLGVAARLGTRAEGKGVEEAYTNLKRLDRREAARFLETLPRRQRLWLTLRGF